MKVLQAADTEFRMCANTRVMDRKWISECAQTQGYGWDMDYRVWPDTRVWAKHSFWNVRTQKYGQDMDVRVYADTRHCDGRKAFDLKARAFMRPRW